MIYSNNVYANSICVWQIILSVICLCHYVFLYLRLACALDHVRELPIKRIKLRPILPYHVWPSDHWCAGGRQLDRCRWSRPLNVSSACIGLLLITEKEQFISEEKKQWWWLCLFCLFFIAHNIFVKNRYDVFYFVALINFPKNPNEVWTKLLLLQLADKICLNYLFHKFDQFFINFFHCFSPPPLLDFFFI